MVTGISATTGTQGFGRIGSLSTIVPFSYRDGMTFQKLLYAIQEHVQTTFPAEVAKMIDATVDALNAELGHMGDELIKNRDEMEAAYARFATVINETYTNFISDVTGKVDTINNKTGAVDIQRITLTKNTVVSVNPSWPNNHPVKFVVTQDSSGNRAVTFADNIDGSLWINPVPGTSTAFELVPNGLGRWTAVPATSDTVSLATDPTAYFDMVKLVTEFPTREAEDKDNTWPQSVSLDPARNRIFVTNYNGVADYLRIDIRDMTTGKRLEFKTFSGLNKDSWTESNPWFINSNGDLCFVVFVKVPEHPVAIAILNYSLGVIGKPILLTDVKVGTAKADVSGDHYIVADAGANSVFAFAVYDWNSVKAGEPRLIKRVLAEQFNAGITHGKNQGVAVSGGKYFMLHGSQTEHFSVTIYNNDGTLNEIKSYPKPTFGKMVNQLAPEKLNVPQDTFFFESEGGTNLNGRIISCTIVGNNSYTGDSRVLILEHGNMTGKHAQPMPVTSMAYDTGWVDLELKEGWTSNVPVQIRRKGNEVAFRGEVFNPDQLAGTYTEVFTIPAGYRVKQETRIPQTTTATVAMSIRIDASGAFRMTTSAPSGGPRTVSHVRYYTD